MRPYLDDVARADRSGRRGRGRELDRRIGPQAVEVVVGAGLVEEDVHDHVAEVHQHPGGVVETFDAARAPVVGEL